MALPPKTNIPATNGKNGDLVKRTGVEKGVEDSMRAYYIIRDERDEALEQLNEIRTKLVEALAEKAILQGHNLDLEQKFERLLVDFTTMRIKIENIGTQGDTISLAVSELLSLSRNTETRQTEPETQPTELPGDQSEIIPHEGETLQELSRRMVQETELHTAARRTPSWLTPKD